jgi:hypothetical protein
MEILSRTCVRIRGGALMGLSSPAQAVSYDASPFVSMTAAPKVPFGTSLTFFPGIRVTPPKTGGALCA